jgi:hypothetical protein
LVKRNLPQQRERPVERAARVGSGDHGVADAAGGDRAQAESVLGQVSARRQGGRFAPQRIERADDDGILARQALLHAQRPPQHASHAAQNLLAGARNLGRVPNGRHYGRQGLAVGTGRGLIEQRLISQPGVAARLGQQTTGGKQPANCDGLRRHGN